MLVASSARHLLVTEKKRPPHLGPPHLEVPEICLRKVHISLALLWWLHNCSGTDCPYVMLSQTERNPSLGPRLHDITCSWIRFKIITSAIHYIFVLNTSHSTLLTESITSENKQKLQDFGFCLCWITKAKAKENLWDYIFIRKCGLLLWLVRAQHDHYESKCKRTSGGIYLSFHYESESEIKSPDFHL